MKSDNSNQRVDLGWANMTERLDHEMPQKNRRSILYVVFLFGLVSSLGFYRMYHNSENILRDSAHSMAVTVNEPKVANETMKINECNQIANYIKKTTKIWDDTHKKPSEKDKSITKVSPLSSTIISSVEKAKKEKSDGVKLNSRAMTNNAEDFNVNLASIMTLSPEVARKEPKDALPDVETLSNSEQEPSKWMHSISAQGNYVAAFSIGGASIHYELQRSISRRVQGLVSLSYYRYGIDLLSRESSDNQPGDFTTGSPENNSTMDADSINSRFAGSNTTLSALGISLGMAYTLIPRISFYGSIEAFGIFCQNSNHITNTLNLEQNIRMDGASQAASQEESSLVLRPTLRLAYRFDRRLSAQLSLSQALNPLDPDKRKGWTEYSVGVRYNL